MNDGDGKDGGGRGDFLTARQLAEVLQVSESTVRRLAREGRIPAVRLTTRLTRYRLDSVLRALDGDSEKPRGGGRPRKHDTAEDGAQLSFEDIL